MLNTMKSMFFALWNIFKYPVYVALALAGAFILTCICQFIYLYAKGHRPIKGQHNVLKKTPFLKKFLVLLPRQFVLDRFMTNPQNFGYRGLHIFCGEQGSGKTIAMVEFMRRMQLEYPCAKCITNFGYKYQDAELRNWKQLLEYNNGTDGVIVGMDELQNWFASGRNQLPDGMLEIVTQNRKNRRIICGTSQVFCRLAKGIREQVTMVYEPVTILGCATWVRRCKYVIDQDGNVKDRKRMGSYWFVHDKELREMYDTYKVIHGIAKNGFVQQPTFNVENRTNVYNVQPRK